jgi:DNA-binding beta-propeller fold protein YncE
LSCWNTVQSGDSEPNGASGIAIDANNTLYVTDGRSHKVRKFATDGTFLGSWGRLGSGANELDSPWGITVDDEGYVYVADHKNHRVQKFTSDGDFVAQIGDPGTKRASLSFPTDVAVDPDGDVYSVRGTRTPGTAAVFKSLTRQVVSSPVWSATRSSSPPGRR